MNLDEGVVLLEWHPEWVAEFAKLADHLKTALGDLTLRIDHIGSTSVPGLVAKDVIDVQVIVTELDVGLIVEAMETAGFTQRIDDWNLRDHIPAGWTGDPNLWSKLVFAPPATARRSNVHIRVAGSPNERYALLFRDFLKADNAARTAWSRFKVELAAHTQTLSEYGAVKDPATDVLLALAARWAQDTPWSVPEA